MRKFSSTGWECKGGRGKTDHQDTDTYGQHVPVVLGLRNAHCFNLSFSLSSLSCLTLLYIRTSIDSCFLSRLL